VTLDSGASDPDGDAVTQEWDLNGDGAFGDASGPTASTAYDTVGAHVVTVRVTDSRGASVSVFETIFVLPIAIGPPSGSSLQWLTPFPIVRVAGTAHRRWTRIRLLTVLTPKGSQVRANCRTRRRCPSTGFSRRASGKLPVILVHVRAFERRIRVGAVVGVWATKRNRVGKYTRLRMRPLQAPARLDRCVVPGHAGPRRCPPRS
jgi:hypothetical protein